MDPHISEHRPFIAEELPEIHGVEVRQAVEEHDLLLIELHDECL